MLRRFLPYLWAAPNTLAALVVVAFDSVGRGASCRVVDGVVEAHGPVIRFLLTRAVPLPGGARAITIGHVVLGISADALDVTRDHERVHVRQYERWGPLFIPAYGVSSLLAYTRGLHYYRDNRFEREAYDAAPARHR